MMTNRVIVTSFSFLVGFLICVNLQAQQIEKLLCESSWWLSNPSEQAVRNATRSIEDLFQNCNSSNDTPLHILLKLEQPLPEMQRSFLMTIFIFERNILFLRNKLGETPLILASLRMGRMFERLSDMGFSDADIDEQERFFSDFYTEAHLYAFIKVLSGELLEDVIREITVEVTLIGLEHLFQQEEFLEGLRERLREHLER